jgi:hypothetical protein
MKVNQVEQANLEQITQAPMKYTVSNTFEVFGIPATEKHDTLETAEKAAEALAEAIAQAFYEREGDQAIIPFYSREGKTGMLNEIKFEADLSEDSGAQGDWLDEENSVPGRMLWSALVDRIYNQAVEIKEETEQSEQS